MTEQKTTMKKYKLTPTKKEGIFQIEALEDFGDVKKGDLGGWVESEKNLSHEGECWVYGNARVYGNAHVFENAKVYGNAHVFENARVYGNAEVHGSAWAYGSAWVYGNAKVFENAKVYGNAWVYGSAWVYGNARVYGSAEVYGSARVYENAKVYEYQSISTGRVISDLSKNIKESIRCQTGLGVFNGKVIAYKQVRKDLFSFHDRSFLYVVGEVAEAETVKESNESCESGLHFSHMNYWNHAENIEQSTFLVAEIKLEDIITVQEGKIRCRKALILGSYDI